MDDQTWEGVVIIGGFIGFIGLIYWLIVSGSRKNYEDLCYLAERLKFKIEEPKPVWGVYQSPELEGEVRGKQVRLYTYTTGTSKSKSTYAAVSVVPREHGGLTFSLTRQGMESRVLEFFGAQEIQVGDEAFDREWFIQSNAPDFLSVGLLPEMRKKIQRFPGKWKLEDGKIVYAEKGPLANRKRCDEFVEIVDTACDLADAAEVYAQHHGEGQS